MSSARPFVHLHCHTDYSLLDGACEIGQLMDLVVEQKMPSVAMTDHGNLFGAVEFYNKAKEKGVHPVIGCEVYVSQQGLASRSDTDRYNHLVLLCENQDGYRNLLKLVSTAFLEGFYYKPRIDKDLLAQHSKGLIAMSACLRGDINETIMANRYEEAKRLAYGYADMFGKDNFFLEIQDHGLDQDKIVTPEVLRLSQETRIPLVATNDSHYMRKGDARAHEILLCIQTGKTMSDPQRMRFTQPEFYLKTRDEMLAMFGEVPETVAALDRTWDIAQRCQVSLEKVKEPFPKFDVPSRALHRQLFRVRGAARLREAARTVGSFAQRRRIEARSGRVCRTFGSRDPHDPADEVFRVLPDCLGLHPFRKIARDSSGAGPRIGRRQPGELCDGDHRHRSARIRAAV